MSYFFHFSDLGNLVQCMDSMVPCYSLNMKVIWLYMVSAHPPITMVGGGDLIWKFTKILRWQNFFLHLRQNKLLWVELKTHGGVIFITILLHFHHFISLKTANTQKNEVFLLRLSLGCVNASVLEKNFLQLCRCIYLRFWPQVLQHLLWRTVPLAMSPSCSI